VEGKIANEVLNVREKVYSDEKISKKEFHTLIHRIIKNLSLTMKFEILSKWRLVRASPRKLFYFSRSY